MYVGESEGKAEWRTSETNRISCNSFSRNSISDCEEESTIWIGNLLR